MEILGEPKEFLGIKIERNIKIGITLLSQENYIDKILKKFGFENSYPKELQ